MGIGIWELLLLFMIVLLIFGTKKLRTVGGDLGGAIRSFRKSMGEAEDEATVATASKEGTGSEASSPKA